MNIDDKYFSLIFKQFLESRGIKDLPRMSISEKEEFTNYFWNIWLKNQIELAKTYRNFIKKSVDYDFDYDYEAEINKGVLDNCFGNDMKQISLFAENNNININGEISVLNERPRILLKDRIIPMERYGILYTENPYEYSDYLNFMKYVKFGFTPILGIFGDKDDKNYTEKEMMLFKTFREFNEFNQFKNYNSGSYTLADNSDDNSYMKAIVRKRK